MLRKLLLLYQVHASIIVMQNNTVDLETINRINRQHIFFIVDDECMNNYYSPILTVHFDLLSIQNKTKYNIKALNIPCQLEKAYCLMRMSSVSNINISSNLLFFQVKQTSIQEHFRLVNKALGIKKHFVIEDNHSITEAIRQIKTNDRIVVYYLSNNVTSIFTYRNLCAKMKIYRLFIKLMLLPMA